MPEASPIDYPALWAFVISQPHHRGPYTVHGPDHWQRVERNACILATKTGANIDVVKLFAVFHDCRRENEGHDPEHGARGAAFAASVRGQWFDLSDEDFARLHYACVWHTDGHHHADPTIGTCWDADRLDLGRVGYTPNARFMSTEFGAEIARHGSIKPWLHLAEPYVTSLATYGR